MIRRDKLLHGWREPATPRPAATILLLRDAPEGLQVLMTRRSAKASFAPGAYVFPGGALDEADAGPASVAVARCRDDQDDAQRHYAAAALREAFEELGVLLAWRAGTVEPCDPSIATALDRSQDADFYGQLAAAGLELAVDRTGWLSHWITDRDLPKRFDVRFFVAPMPAGQHAEADGAEQFEPVWVNPADGLARHEAGTFSMIFPTIRTLRQLQRFGTVEEVLHACRTQASVFTSCPRGGRVAGKDTRFTEDEMPFGELELVAPDGQMVHSLDWRTDEVVPLRRNVRRLTAPNPGMMTGPGTNTYIVGEDGAWIVIDPGPALPSHVERIAALVRDGLQAIVCTHSHPDHSPGAPLLRD
nr:MBL fold metallo-hydrolase [Gemmatimonadaceae bacterium]